MYYTKDNIKITARTYIDENGNQYPCPQWFNGATDEQLADLGIVRHADPVVPDYDVETQQVVTLDSGEYSVVDLSLDEAKARKRNQINNKRNQLETSGFEYSGVMFDSDQRSVDRIQIATAAAQSAAMSGQLFTIDWTAMDNSEMTLDANGMMALNAAFAEHGRAVFETAKTLKQQIDIAQTLDELTAIQWPE